MAVILIEDEAKIAELYSQVFIDCGVRFAHFPNAEDALLHLMKERYRLAIIDLMLPGMSGVDFVAEIQSLNYDEKLSIVVLTNMGSGFDKQSLLRMGVKEVILKLEVGPKELKALVDKYCYH